MSDKMKKIVEQFKKINEIQATIITICDEKITMIPQKKHNEVQTLIKKEMLALHDLEQALHKLKAIIAETCREVLE